MERSLGLARPYSSLVYRIVSERWCGPADLLAGGSQRGGSWLDGGRWNPRGRASGRRRPTGVKPWTWLLQEGFRTAYTSPRIETAAAEVYWHAKRPVPGQDLRADFWDLRRVGVANVKLDKVLDLARPEVLAFLGLDPKNLTAEWLGHQEKDGKESLTQAVGRMARYLGVHALLCPSARHHPDGINLVIFPDNIDMNTRTEWIESREVPMRFRRL